MSIYVILARAKWGEKCTPFTQVSGAEGKAVNLAQKIFKDGGMNRTIVVDSKLKIIFKQDRRCRCSNSQYQLNGELRCEDCGRVIPTAKYRIEEYQK